MSDERRCVAELACPSAHHAAALVVWVRERRPDLELVEVRIDADRSGAVLVAGSAAGLARLAIEQRAVNEAADALGTPGARRPPLREEEAPHDGG